MEALDDATDVFDEFEDEFGGEFEEETRYTCEDCGDPLGPNENFVCDDCLESETEPAFV